MLARPGKRTATGPSRHATGGRPIIRMDREKADKRQAQQNHATVANHLGYAAPRQGDEDARQGVQADQPTNRRGIRRKAFANQGASAPIVENYSAMTHRTRNRSTNMRRRIAKIAQLKSPKSVVIRLQAAHLHQGNSMSALNPAEFRSTHSAESRPPVRAHAPPQARRH